MNVLLDALRWIVDPANWVDASGIDHRIAQHVAITGLVVGLAALVALPVGVLVGHTGRGRALVVGLSGAARALPTLGLLTLLGLALGIGLRAPVIALVVLAVPSVLAGAYAGVESVSPAAVDVARAVGMTEWQIVRRVEIPLGLPIIVGGIRAAVLQVVATATLAAYIADAGLGRYLFEGLKTRNYAEMLGGSLLVAVLAFVLEGVFALLQRASAPTAVRPATTRTTRRQLVPGETDP